MASTVTVRGPLFDGQADDAVTRWLEQTRHDVGRQAQSIVKSKYARMDKTGRATGSHVDSIRLLSMGTDVIVRGESNRGQIFWPWLEGTSRRNTTTRFRGYHAFRIARGVAAKRMRKIAQDELDKYIGEMGGHP